MGFIRRIAMVVGMFCICVGVGRSGRFSTPIWAPTARWEKSLLVNVENCGDPLDGPVLGVQTNRKVSLGVFFEGGGDWYLRKYDPDKERFYTVGGDAAGYLDGPLSRARFNAFGYAKERAIARSPDGRYMYFTEPCLGFIVRLVDFQKGKVRTVAKDVKMRSITVDSKGNLWGVTWGTLVVITPDGKVEKRKIETPSGTIGYALSIVLDEVKNRLYGMRRDTRLWYWDLKTGKCTDVYNDKTCKTPHRRKCATGPFEGMWLHCPAGLKKFPWDKEVRFLYVGGGDDRSFYRMDLKKRYMHRFTFAPEAKGKHKRLFYFGDAPGKVNDAIEGWCGPPGWLNEDGDFTLGSWRGGGSKLYLFRRVK